MKRAKLGLVIVALLAAFAIGRATVERAADSDSDDAPGGRASVAEVWTCSMDPQVRRDGPGTCPFCGMELVPASSIPSSSAPTEVVLSERARTLAAVRTVEVGGGAEDVDDSERRRFVARVAVDETRQEVVTTWTAGRIDRLHVRATGARVARGQVVATIYSPEVYGAHQDLLVARRHLERVSEGPLGDAARASVESARERLRLLGFEGDALAELERASAPARQVPVRSPASGTVIERLATQGAYVAAGAPLYRVARLDRVWAKLDAYERDLPRLAVGQAVTLRFEGLTEPIEGRVAFVGWPRFGSRCRTRTGRCVRGWWAKRRSCSRQVRPRCSCPRARSSTPDAARSSTSRRSSAPTRRAWSPWIARVERAIPRWCP
jgi:Cu(I)/Ag(I) efflux system membrane fusion protein